MTPGCCSVAGGSSAIEASRSDFTSGHGSRSFSTAASAPPFPATSAWTFGHALERLAQHDELARPGQPADDAVRQSLQVRQTVQRLTDLGAPHPVVEERLHLVQPVLDASRVEQRFADPLPQQTPADGRDGLVDDAQE